VTGLIQRKKYRHRKPVAAATSFGRRCAIAPHLSRASRSAIAAAMVLFAASSFAGPTPSAVKGGDLEARLDIGLKSGSAANPSYRVGDDLIDKNQSTGQVAEFSWTNGTTYRFVSEYSAAKGSVSFDILKDMDLKRPGGYSAFASKPIAWAENDLKKNSFYKVSLNVNDSADVNIEFTNLMFNGHDVNGGIWDTGSESLYYGKALADYKVEGLFTVTGINSKTILTKNGKTVWDKVVYEQKNGKDTTKIDTNASTPMYVQTSNLVNNSYFNVVYSEIGKVGTSPAAIPEPTTLALLPLALGGAFFASCRRKAAAK
jgi:hypothetical protein